MSKKNRRLVWAGAINATRPHRASVPLRDYDLNWERTSAKEDACAFRRNWQETVSLWR